MEITILAVRNDDELKEATAAASALMDTEDEASLLRLRAQVKVIQDYTSRRYRQEPAGPVDIIRHLMDANGITGAEMAQILGSRSRVSEILNGKRGLSTLMIRRLADRFNVSPALFFERCSAK